MSEPVTAPVALDIAHHFASLPDPRHPSYRDHHLLGDILVIALSALFAGSDSWDEIAEFGQDEEDWLRSIGLKLPNGIPSHDTFNRIFSALNPLAFQQCFSSWIQSVCSSLDGQQVAVDGKALRGSRGPDGTCLHTVCAWVREARLTLAQRAVDHESNEITAIPELLRLLDLKGTLVTIDAAGCQKEIVRQIREQDGDYLIAVKGNQPTLYADVEAEFARVLAGDLTQVRHGELSREEKGHGRVENRVYTALYEPEGLTTREEWRDLKTIVQVVRTRRTGKKESLEIVYYVSSSTAEVEVLAEAIRGHWSIENGLHWSLDVLFGEDRNRTRQGHAAENLGWMRRMCLSAIRKDGSKGSGKAKRLRAARSRDYRLKLLKLLLG